MCELVRMSAHSRVRIHVRARVRVHVRARVRVRAHAGVRVRMMCMCVCLRVCCCVCRYFSLTPLAGPAPSYRLKMIREGMEDSDYFKLLANKNSTLARSIARQVARSW